jgi:hypothetical protein
VSHWCAQLVTFLVLHCDQIPDRNNLREERFILDYCLREFCLWSLGPIHMGRTSWWWEHMAEVFLYFLVYRKQRKGDTGKARFNLTDMPQWPTSSSGAPAPTFPHLTIMPSYYESVKVIH